MVATLVRTIFAQSDAVQVRAQFARVVDQLQAKFPAAAELLVEAEADLLAFCDFPVEHWRQIGSNNTQERLNKELRRRTDVVGIFLRVPLRRIRCFGDGYCKAPEGPRVTRNLSVELSDSDLVRASPLGSLRWPRDLIAA